MSLDIMLKDPKKPTFKCSTGIYIRENGQNKELSLEEAQQMYPDADIYLQESYSTVLYSSNITHNLARMAEEADIYRILWRPEEAGIDIAEDLIDPLQEGLNRLKSDPEKYKEFNPENGWGSYDTLVKFVEDLLNACYKYPYAIVEADR